MTEVTNNIKHIQLREDAKDIRIEYLAGNQYSGIATYIKYISESHPHKYCMYIIYGK